MPLLKEFNPFSVLENVSAFREMSGLPSISKEIKSVVLGLAPRSGVPGGKLEPHAS
jgi:hypothetical protein